MAFPKRTYFSKEDQLLSGISLVLSHPARLFIAKTLWDEGPQHVLELEKVLPLVQASVSHHLCKMRELGLVEAEEHRLFNKYYLNKEKLDEIAREYELWFLSFQTK